MTKLQKNKMLLQILVLVSVAMPKTWHNTTALDDEHGISFLF
jgi:hypothetical protein